MTNSITSTNVSSLNSVVIDLLMGAKSVGNEIYAASKEGIASAVAFTQEQAPMVMNEFLMWKFMNSTLNFIGYVCLIILFLAIIRYVFKLAKSMNDEAVPSSLNDDPVVPILGALSMILIMSRLVFLAGAELKEMVQIKVAPRIYTIEWVSKQVSQMSTKINVDNSQKK